jgi:phosphopantothenoylcysteine decarboxylase/phosphopantothenate--cysteine ligase
MNAITARRVVLGITGGVAAYKAAELTRLLKKSGIEVQVVMTEAGCRFVTPVTMQALSGNTVYIDAWDARIDNQMPHIELSRTADAIIVAPATADFLAKLAHGLANDLLSTLCLARRPTCPLIVAPAMNREMWENPATQRNITRLRDDGVLIAGPAAGEQACGETGMGRMIEPGALLSFMRQTASTGVPVGPFAGRRVMVTAGPTFEPLDPVRGITNRSSGKMGYAIAQSLLRRGAIVTLISGPTNLEAPPACRTINIQTAWEMFEAVKHNIKDIDAFFAVAAVADYTPSAPSENKLKKTEGGISINLSATQDILSWVAQIPDRPFCVGFAAESHNIVEYARKKRENKKIDVIVANHAPSAIGADENEVTILDAFGDHPLAKCPKAELADKIVAHAELRYANWLKSSANSV